ncbi:MAG: tetratricopeptide repeat protein [Sediminibacterium sp.]
MKKFLLLLPVLVLMQVTLLAQYAEGIKLLNYDKNKSAKEVFQKLADANPQDPQAIYWLGQALLATDGGEPGKEQIAAAKALYQKGLASVGSNPWLVVGMGHIELLERGDINSVKQKFEQAITASTETKGKNKGQANAGILNAIGRANAKIASGVGDNLYAIEKLNQAGQTDLTNPDIFINKGINYLKMGGENGGEAVKAYQEALTRDPKSALAFYRIGKVYQSQNNKELFEQNFDNAITADPACPLPYFAYYLYYANRDVNRAKEYLDKYVATADKDPQTDFFEAYYLFRAGKNDESLLKVAELEKSVGTTELPRLNMLYAYNYDRKGDSVQAKSYLEKFFANAPAEKIESTDYELAVKVLTRFPGSEVQAAGYLEKAIATDTSTINKQNYMQQAADMFAKAKNFSEQLNWLKRLVSLKGTTTEADYYKLTASALGAKDYAQTIELAKTYMAAYPDKPQPYSFFRRAAIASDPDTTSGKGVENLAYLDSIYGLNKDKFKRELFLNKYYTILYYINKQNSLKKSPDFKVKSDGTKTEVVDQFLAICQKSLLVTDQMIELYPDVNDDNNKFAQGVKSEIQKNIDYYSKPPVKKPNAPAAPPVKG